MNTTVVTLDFETYWDNEHTLSKMSPIEYCTSPKTEVISLGIKVGSYPTDVLFGEEAIAKALSKMDFSGYIVVGHNMSGFDSMLLAWRFGVRPRMWGCTLAMARPIHAKTIGNSLEKLVAHYGLGVKDKTALVNTKGKRLKDFTPQELDAMREYNRSDVEQCRALFDILLKHYSAKELWLIDATIRMLVEPGFEVDTGLLETALTVERDRKRKLIYEVAELLRKRGLSEERPEDFSAQSVEDLIRKDLASAAKFACVLEMLGVEVPTKPSPADPAKQIPALAKTDEGFLKLVEHKNELVAAAARARLSIKSTLLETRIEAFLRTAKSVGGKLPAPLHYCGADTTGRWSGWAYNIQNLIRITPGKPKPSDALRKSLRAPKGYKVVVADQSGIELRVNHFLWQVPESMELYNKDPQADLYRAFAAARYGIKPEEVTKEQRQLAKVAQLGLGFGAGWKTFQRVAKLMGGLDLPDEEAEAVTTAWRAQYAEIVLGWRKCHAALDAIYVGAETEIDPWGLCKTTDEGIVLPSGRVIRYPSLHQEANDDGKTEWWYGTGRHRARIYAGKVTENCLSEGTLVLTNSGWKPIESVQPTDMVHDGVEFVKHDGVVFKSVQPCVELDGVFLTPDHEVLTDAGWKEASQVQRPYRPDIRDVDGLTSRGVNGQNVEVALSVPLRKSGSQTREERDRGSQTRRDAELRVYDQTTNLQGHCQARHVEAPGLRSLAIYAGSVRVSVSQSVAELRRTWHNGLRSLARVFRELLGGHDAYVPAGFGFGQGGQQRAVLAGELPLGEPANQYHEQAKHGARCGRSRVEPDAGHSSQHALLSAEARLEAGGLDARALTDKPVYDILNCGPRHRFVVKGDSGPMIAHNCVQALARDIIADNAVEFYKATRFRPAMMVHDELVYVVPESQAEAALDELQAVMRTPPKWWPELVVWSEGALAPTYGDAK